MTEAESLRVLVIDDNHSLLKALGIVFARQGWTVTSAYDGREARERLKAGSFDVIVSDVNMPGYGGLEFLRIVREQDLDVPVVLMTGSASVESSIRALEYGAFRYLVKPIPNEKMVEVVQQAARLHRLAKLKREAMLLSGSPEHRLREGAALEISFARSLDLMFMAFQPIMDCQNRTVFGNEALLRSDDPLMNNPADIIDAAERLGRVHELGRKVRAHVAVAAQTQKEPQKALFVNLHSSDLSDDELFLPNAPLSMIAHRVVLEVTERASLDDVKDVPARVERLKEMGFRIAVDDLGVGYAGLSSFTLLAPQLAKLDMSLVRGIDTDPKRQSIVRSMKALCDELQILVVAEGVETKGERDTLRGFGCDLLQGYLFAKPARVFPVPQW